MTAQESQYTDGAWYWVEIESWGVKKSAPAMYKADCEAFYSFEFAGIPTRQVEVLEPCRRAPQAQPLMVHCVEKHGTARPDGTIQAAHIRETVTPFYPAAQAQRAPLTDEQLSKALAHRPTSGY